MNCPHGIDTAKHECTICQIEELRALRQQVTALQEYNNAEVERRRKAEARCEALKSALAGEKAKREHDRSVRWALPQQVKDGNPDDIRAFGWAVAVHNDYNLNGVKHTFWLFTKGDRNVKGEGLTDAEALNEVRAALAATEVPNG